MIAHSCPEFSLNNSSTLVAISGSGNVSQFTALKVIELGATVLSLSDSKGTLLASGAGFTKEMIHAIGQLKLKGGSLESYASLSSDSRYSYHAGKSRDFLSSETFLSLLLFRLPSLDTRTRGPHRPSRCYTK